MTGAVRWSQEGRKELYDYMVQVGGVDYLGFNRGDDPDTLVDVFLREYPQHRDIQPIILDRVRRVLGVPSTSLAGPVAPTG